MMISDLNITKVVSGVIDATVDDNLCTPFIDYLRFNWFRVVMGEVNIGGIEWSKLPVKYGTEFL